MYYFGGRVVVENIFLCNICYGDKVEVDCYGKSDRDSEKVLVLRYIGFV